MFRDRLLDYVREEKKIIEEQIEQLQSSPEQKQIEEGFLVNDLILVNSDGNDLLFATEVNNTKLKTGDRAILYFDSKRIDVVIIENISTEISLTIIGRTIIPIGSKCMMQISIPQLLDPVIESYERLSAGAPGWHFLQILSASRQPDIRSNYTTITNEAIDLKIQPLSLTETQKRIVRRACYLPSYLGIQGPPGTGKSFLLSVIADIISSENKRVVVLAHTHQAVNNCLEAIHKQNPLIKLIKIGEKLKAKDLNSAIETKSFYELNQSLRNKSTQGLTIVGMTIYSAILNLGLKRNLLNPNVILVDEAGQIPLSIGALIGFMGAGSNIFFGDDMQMPPIFQQELVNDPLSVSIFSHIRSISPNFIDKLDVTYRMNSELTDFIGRNFYFDRGTGRSFLTSSNVSANQELSINTSAGNDLVKRCLGISPSLIVVEDDNTPHVYDVVNPEQAQKIALLIDFLSKQNFPMQKVAVVTPFRKQVNEIKNHLASAGLTQMPIVDTVERVQGITVDIVFFSVCSTKAATGIDKNEFVFTPNRINVALSRARVKAVVFGEIPFQ